MDWTRQGWKVLPLDGGHISYLCTSGGSAPNGQEPPKTFDGLCVDLRSHYTDAGSAPRTRTRAPVPNPSPRQARFCP